MSEITEREVTLLDCLPLMLEKLSMGAEVEFTAHGTSMKPLLHDSSVTISPAPNKLKLLDMPLYRRKNGQFVLHRVVRINRDGSYAMCGDNQIQIESPIFHEQVIGLVTSFDWDGVKTCCTDPCYIKYAKKRIARQKRLRIYYKVRGFGGKILRKLHLKK